MGYDLLKVMDYWVLRTHGFSIKNQVGSYKIPWGIRGYGLRAVWIMRGSTLQTKVRTGKRILRNSELSHQI